MVELERAENVNPVCPHCSTEPGSARQSGTWYHGAGPAPQQTGAGGVYITAQLTYDVSALLPTRGHGTVPANTEELKCPGRTLFTPSPAA